MKIFFARKEGVSKDKKTGLFRHKFYVTGAAPEGKHPVRDMFEATVIVESSPENWNDAIKGLREVLSRECTGKFEILFPNAR
jgi:hypothetical protein